MRGISKLSLDFNLNLADWTMHALENVPWWTRQDRAEVCLQAKTGVFRGTGRGRGAEEGPLRANGTSLSSTESPWAS